MLTTVCCINLPPNSDEVRESYITYRTINLKKPMKGIEIYFSLTNIHLRVIFTEQTLNPVGIKNKNLIGYKTETLGGEPFKTGKQILRL